MQVLLISDLYKSVSLSIYELASELVLELKTSRTFDSSISRKFCYTHTWQVYKKAT